MDRQSKRVPKQKHDRVILQFDYDCFYAQVFENKDPELKSRALGVRQKNILATCNYNARRLGVKKLMLVSEARRICKDLVLVDGEDLTPFRDVSKVLFNFLRSHSWSNRAERLGFDEVFMDVTDVIDYNIECLNTGCLSDSFFHLSRKDPQDGFKCDFTVVSGCVQGRVPDEAPLDNETYLRLVLGSHLANHLRTRIEVDYGYTSTCGISTNKLLSKLVGSRNKPRNQTTLMALNEQDVIAFMDSHKTRQIPGLGLKTSTQLESHVLGQEVDADSHSLTTAVSVRHARLHPSMSPGLIEALLAGPGAEKGIGVKVWGLLHGIDPTEVKEAGDIPSQISIEDTYKGLETIPRITEELHKLSCSLIRRMRMDLLAADHSAEKPGTQRWIARPKTLRLAVRSWPTRRGGSSAPNFSRTSRSGPLPNLVFDALADVDALAQKLVAEALLPLLRRLQPDQGPPRWNLQLINVCVANMVAGAGDDKQGSGRDISAMFKRQDEVLRPFKLPEPVSDDESRAEANADDVESLECGLDWGDADHSVCQDCGHWLPPFAMPAHVRYHEMGE
ncbi:DNA-repair protein, UmuC-like protein [Metarhizium album ARSEF 1941]|uniref:DNA-repair protein, UmuC-like protein n=1 Tax=Metarhizium album (strain ARSEF 1941) TaxID=1081103 RepID=A0A0B2X6I8_METAS|nr:DNA-repair protein, UmuC-like protein [Metarhizium album ARSEF 1941]KHO02009.1 DNA-repair protein, UmuC-like protein [Metarhizium album ARSEF 1941]